MGSALYETAIPESIRPCTAEHPLKSPPQPNHKWPMWMKMLVIVGLLLIAGVPLTVAGAVCHGDWTHCRNHARMAALAGSLTTSLSVDAVTPTSGVSVEIPLLNARGHTRPRTRTRTPSSTIVPSATSAFSSSAPARTSLTTILSPSTSTLTLTSAPLVTPASGSSSVFTGSSSGLWTPTAGDTWQIVLTKTLKVDSTLPAAVRVYDVDLFDTPSSTIAALHAQGKKVICYFSGGSYENWRPDASDFAASDIGKELDGWEGENWVRLSGASVRNVMKKRIKMAADKGCDAIDPDNVDGFANDNGLGLTSADSVAFVKFLAAEAAALGMSTGLKNAATIVKDLVDVVHFSVNEECAKHNECGDFAAFTNAGKPVFHIEYTDSVRLAEACSGASAYKFSTVYKNMDLDGWVQYCDGTTFTSPTA